MIRNGLIEISSLDEFRLNKNHRAGWLNLLEQEQFLLQQPTHLLSRVCPGAWDALELCKGFYIGTQLSRNGTTWFCVPSFKHELLGTLLKMCVLKDMTMYTGFKPSISESLIPFKGEDFHLSKNMGSLDLPPPEVVKVWPSVRNNANKSGRFGWRLLDVLTFSGRSFDRQEVTKRLWYLTTCLFWPTWQP